jgi:hypothetical protein
LRNPPAQPSALHYGGGRWLWRIERHFAIFRPNHRYTAHGTREISRSIAIERMLRHILVLPILLLCLLIAGVPAFACGEAIPTRDCCPNGPNGPCAPEQARTAEANRLDLCCASSDTIATTTASAIPSNERGKHWDGAAPPAVLVALTTLTTAYVQASPVHDFRIPSQPLSDSTLYLSTGRLRL